MLARWRAPEALFGAAIAGLGVFLLVAGREIFSPAPWGPGLMPNIVGVGLFVLGLATVGERIGTPAVAQATDADDWRGFVFVLAGLVAFGLLVEMAGFPLAAAALFALVARGQGSRALGRDFLIGFALALAAYAVFALGLGLPLGWGGALQSALGAR